MGLVSDIKLIRTDTTLDLSQKAEKGMPPLPRVAFLILQSLSLNISDYGTSTTSLTSTLPACVANGRVSRNMFSLLK
jgi:hypothetical protein